MNEEKKLNYETRDAVTAGAAGGRELSHRGGCGHPQYDGDSKKMSPAEAGRAALAVLKANCAHAGEFSDELLIKILRDNENTEYGVAHDFSKIRSIEDFKKNIPFTEYDDYAEGIERMLRGEKNIFTVYPIVHYALTSGSVGNPKRIPVSAQTMELYAQYTSNAATALAADYIRDHEHREMKSGKRILTAVVSQTKVADGTPCGSISGAMYMNAREVMKHLVASPKEVLYSTEKMDFKYLKSFYALKEPDVTCMVAPFTTALYDLLHYIELNWEKLVGDIRRGRLDEEANIPDALREKFNADLGPDPKRADELSAIFEQGFDEPFVPRVWKNMEYINAIGSGGFVVYTNKLRRYTGGIPMTFCNYGASEALMGVVTEVESMDYTLIPQGGYYEFLPTDAEGGEAELRTQTLKLNELRVGQDYEIIITNFSGFYRYRIGDVITVNGYEGESPKICFKYRKKQLISIAGEKTNDSAVRFAVEEFSKAVNMPVNDYSIYADTDANPGRYVVFIEPHKHLPKEKYDEYRAIIEDKLSNANPSFGAKVREGILAPTVLKFVQPETYALYRDLMIMKGTSENQLKPVRVIDNLFKEKFFFKLVDED